MNNNRVKNIVAGHYRKMAASSKNYFAGFDAEAIHRFRVEYKKLRAFLRMLSFNSGKEPLKISGSLKKVYAAAGILRDLQIQQLLVANATKGSPKKPLAFFHLLQNEAAGLKSEITELLKEKPVAESKKKIIARLPYKLSQDTFTDFSAEKWNAAGGIMREGNFSDSNIHSIRKNLKDIFYTRKDCKNLLPVIPGTGPINQNNEAYFEALLEELGVFHDCCVGIALLKQQWLYNLKAYSQTLLEETKKDWIRKKLKMKQQLLIKLKELFLPHQLTGNNSKKTVPAAQC